MLIRIFSATKYGRYVITKIAYMKENDFSCKELNQYNRFFHFILYQATYQISRENNAHKLSTEKMKY